MRKKFLDLIDKIFGDDMILLIVAIIVLFFVTAQI